MATISGRLGLLSLAAAAAVYAADVRAVPISYETGPLTFSTSGQSMWGTGDAFQLDRTTFAGVTWNESASVDAIFGGVDEVTIVPSVCDPIGWFGGGCTDPVTATVDTRTGFAADIHTEGRLGFEIGFSVDSGSVDAQVEYLAALTIPDSGELAPGVFTNLNASSSFGDANGLQTTFPTAAGSLSLVAEASAELGAVGCFIGSGCTPRGEISTGTLGGTLELISFNENGEGGIEYFDGDPVLNTLLDIGAQAAGVPLPDGLPLELPINIGKDPLTASPRNVGELVLHLPQPNTTGDLAGGTITSTAADDFLDFDIDVDNLISLASTALATSGASVNSELFNPGGTISVGDLSLTAEFNIIDVDLIPNIDLRQSFELTPTLMVDMEFSQPIMIDGMTGPQTSYSGAWDSLPDFAFLPGATVVTPTFWIGALLNDQLAFDLNVDFLIDLLTVEFGLEAFGVSVPITGPLGIGNVFGASENLFTTPPLFDQTFALEGFNRIAGDSFVVNVSEPGTLALLAIAAAMSWLGRRRPRPRRIRL